MLVWRSSRRAVRLAEALTAPHRGLSMASRPSTRLAVVSVLQQLPSGPRSRRNPPANGPISWRLFSSSSTSQEEKEKEDEAMERLEQRGTAMGGQIVYEGPMNRAVRLMKGVSVTSCILTSVGMPVLCVLSEQDASIVGKVGSFVPLDVVYTVGGLV
ncbi:hypothetical protein BBJ28_00009507 [Nothophytophthora sp. Chile5]|nr:hypothetical protein BBJ28_00009507 [Nothophytophthora sp. Chile5]